MQNNLLPASIEMRALEYMGSGLDAVESVKKAIEDENNMLHLVALGIDMKNGRYRPDVKEAVCNELCERVYKKIKEK